MIDGITDYTSNLLGEIQRLPFGADWQWLCRRPRWYDSPISSHHGLRLVRPTHGWNALGTALTKAVIRWLKPDLIHIHDEVHSFYETDAAVEIADCARCPVVVTVGEFHIERPSVRHTIQLLKKADVVLCNDLQTSRRCLEFGGRGPDYQGWVSSSVLPDDSQERGEREAGLCSTFGIINQGKLLPMIHEALTQLRGEGHEVRWQIIGRFDPVHDPFHAELADRFMDSWVTFTGYAEPARLRALLARSSLMILPYIDGATQGRTTLPTAWLFGLPAVTNPATVAEPAVQHEVNCLLVKERNSRAWAAAIGRVLKDPGLAARLCAGGRETAERLSWRGLAELHVKIYGRILS